MKIAVGAFTSILLVVAPVKAEECRRVTTPTVLAIVAHGGVWTRTADRGKTFRVSKCGIRMFGKVYCQLLTDVKPPVYLQDGDAGKEYTAFWGKSCR